MRTNYGRKKKMDGELGPCYDLCMCRHCWNGWKGESFFWRLKQRVYYIWRGHS